MTIKELLVGKKVRHEGKVYTVQFRNEMAAFYINLDGQTKHIRPDMWTLVEPISFKPSPHKHVLKCSECGESLGVGKK